MTARVATVLVLLLAAAVPRAARAQRDAGVNAAPDRCAPLRAENARLARQVATTETSASEADARAQHCEADAAERERAYAESQEAVRRMQGDRDETCRASDALVQSFLLSQPVPPEARACVSDAHSAALVQRERGTAAVLSALEALGAFADGSVDRSPHAPRADTELEAALAKALGDPRTEAPLVYRRVLAEAYRRAAPEFWTALQARPGRDAAAWLQSDTPLDLAFVAEVRARTTSGAAAPLVVSLRLARAFDELAGCREERSPHGCARAQQLVELLETSGPLVVERREESLWATDCDEVSPEIVASWLAELPGSPLARADSERLAGSAYAKLFGCYLGAQTDASFRAWLGARLPAAMELRGALFERVEGLRTRFRAGGEEDRCAEAVRALRHAADARACALGSSDVRTLSAWHPGSAPPDDLALATCDQLARALWRGHGAEVPRRYARPPGAADLVVVSDEAAGAAAVRSACDARIGTASRFPDDLAAVARIAAAWGDAPAAAPWRVDARTHVPIEQLRERGASTLDAWARAAVARTDACTELGLAPSRCAACAASHGDAYDCVLARRLDARRTALTRAAVALGASMLLALLLGAWARRQVRARRMFGAWRRAAREALGRAGVKAWPLASSLLFPSRVGALVLELPRGHDWERWGRRAVVLRAAKDALTARDVDEAVALARRAGAEVALLAHSGDASPELGAVRAMLDWAARGAQAVQVLPVSSARLEWARSPSDLLDLVEQTSLRGNPFEIRGRITSASQFFDRERLVSGLLATVQAGQWTLITGLRRMGKSSLALEVARQLNGPSAYVDFAGFHHEMAHVAQDVAATAVLRYVCVRLAESARERFGVDVAAPPDGDLDATRLAAWFQAYAAACGSAGGARVGHSLVVFDELEQAIGVGPGRVRSALDVLGTVLGRLRAALGDPAAPGARACVGVLLCGAIHPLLWAPLAPFGGASLVSALPRVCVPRLDDDAAASMMRGLGARQGIRFTEEALDLIIREAQGIPLLVRRLGSSVLELYDPDRARQGGLGAVEVGREGASAAVRREEDEGAPLRVWVQSEIGEPQSPAGQVLRVLAAKGEAPADELRAVARRETRARLEAGGLGAVLDDAELDRRCEEAGSVTLQLLVETGLVEAHGDLTRPERYSLPDALLRRILVGGGARSPFDLT